MNDPCAVESNRRVERNGSIASSYGVATKKVLESHLADSKALTLVVGLCEEPRLYGSSFDDVLERISWLLARASQFPIV